jgi:hypothetical protein
MRQLFWPVALAIAVITLLTLQSTNAYGQRPRGCRWWSRSYVTVWFRPGPSRSVVIRPAEGVSPTYSRAAQLSEAPGSIAVRPRAAREPKIVGLGDEANMNFFRMVVSK